MERIGIREAKNSLTKYIRRAKKGEPFLITERGVPVAKLMPLETVIPASIGKLLENKTTVWNGGKPGARKPAVIKHRSQRTLAEYIEEDRR